MRRIFFFLSDSIPSLLSQSSTSFEEFRLAILLSFIQFLPAPLSHHRPGRYLCFFPDSILNNSLENLLFLSISLKSANDLSNSTDPAWQIPVVATPKRGFGKIL